MENNLEELVKLAQRVDKILKEELDKAKISYDSAKSRIYNTRTVGVQGDERTYSYPVEITLYQKDKFVWKPRFIERLSTRITNEIREINRVVYTVENK